MPIPRDDAPLVVTAHLDAAAFAALDALRRRHFPAPLNKVPAHVSLFHKLPAVAIAEIAATIAEACAAAPPFELRPAGVVSLGRGVAVRYDSEALAQLHAALACRFAPWLTPQDRQRFNAHVTIQNKVEPAQARALLESLTLDMAPVCRVEGVTLWRYRGGPWERVATYPLAAAQYGETTR